MAWLQGQWKSLSQGNETESERGGGLMYSFDQPLCTYVPIPSLICMGTIDDKESQGVALLIERTAWLAPKAYHSQGLLL